MSYRRNRSPQNAVARAPLDAGGGGVFGADSGESHHFHQPGGRVSAGVKPPLGKRGNSLTPPHGKGEQTADTKTKKVQENKAKRLRGRRDLVADQMRASSIYWHYANKAVPGTKLPGRGVTFCGWTQIAEMPTELLRVQEETGHRAYFSGVQVCGLRWVCPCCTANAAQTDRCLLYTSDAADE